MRRQSSLPSDRTAGVGLHISSLPGPYGIGDLGAGAHDFVDALKKMRLGVWQLLPLGPTGYGNSPYQPLSSFAGNEMLIAPDDLLELGLLSDSDLVELRRLPADHVDFDRLIPLKTKLLATAATRFASRAGSALLAEFDRFQEAHGAAWLNDYALFRLLKTLHGGRAWPDWDDDYTRRDPRALKHVTARNADALAAIRIQQFFFDRQWRRLRERCNDAGIRLLGDLPIYVALDSADAWSARDLLRLDADGRPDAVAGVPPDYFSADGQLWGNPLYDWAAHAASGYAWWIDRVRASLRLADLVRIDHFRGFESYWAVPAGADTARSGRWEAGPGDALFDAMRDALGGLPIVAEDLGIITRAVEELRDRQQLPGMVVLQFAVCDPEFDYPTMRENCVCYTGTHDNDTTLGWYMGTGTDTRDDAEIRETREAALALTGGTAETVVQDFVTAAFASNARMAVVPMPDLLGLGSEARMNTPGRGGDNWCWRVLESQINDKLCDNVANITGRTGREVADG